VGFVAVLALMLTTSVGFGNDVIKHLQDVSVTIKSEGAFGGGQGSGVIVTRDVEVSKGKTVKVNFVWTAAHVIDNLRTVRKVVDPQTGVTKSVIDFKPAHIVKELVENGRRVGEVKMEAVVIKYSHSEEGEDLALLMVRKRDFVQANSNFFLDTEEDSENLQAIDLGTELYHVGSLLGQFGSNSLTTGVISQVGRVLDLSSGEGTVFDQTTVTAFPGSSGGGVFLKDGRYIGMLVRGAGETFNLIVPVRRMHTWAKENKVEWAMNKSVKIPTLKELRKITVDDSVSQDTDKTERSEDSKQYDFLFKYTPVETKE